MLRYVRSGQLGGCGVVKELVMKVKRRLWTWVFAVLAACSLVLGVGGVNTAYAAAGDTPPHTKNITDNQDGTYTISLDIVGEAEKKPNNVNVIVIFDTSGSMNTQRMTAAKNAVNSLARSLYAYNTQSEPNTVEMALVRFATSSSVAQAPTNSQTTFTNTVNGLGNQGNGGTNWESALQTANGVDFGDEDQTFVVFVSDGNPTFRTTQNGWNDWSYDYRQWGTGQETTQNIQRCYTTAVDDAQALAQKVGVKNFFTIGAFGNVDRMEQLTDDAGSDSSTNYYSASDTAALNQAIADILAKIEMAGFANAAIDDGCRPVLVDGMAYDIYPHGLHVHVQKLRKTCCPVLIFDFCKQTNILPAGCIKRCPHRFQILRGPDKGLHYAGNTKMNSAGNILQIFIGKRRQMDLRSRKCNAFPSGDRPASSDDCLSFLLCSEQQFSVVQKDLLSGCNGIPDYFW